MKKDNKEKKDIAKDFVLKMLKILHIRVSKKTENLFVQIFKFTIVGGIATIIDFMGIYILKEFIHLPVIIANTIACIIATVYNYIASVRWVFDVDQEKDKKKTFITFVIFSIIGLILNDIIMALTIKWFNLFYILAKVVATVFVMIFNFITRKIFLE